MFDTDNTHSWLRPVKSLWKWGCVCLRRRHLLEQNSDGRPFILTSRIWPAARRRRGEKDCRHILSHIIAPTLRWQSQSAVGGGWGKGCSAYRWRENKSEALQQGICIQKHKAVLCLHNSNCEVISLIVISLKKPCNKGKEEETIKKSSTPKAESFACMRGQNLAAEGKQPPS